MAANGKMYVDSFSDMHSSLHGSFVQFGGLGINGGIMVVLFLMFFRNNISST
jgi:hypothetical protein